MANFESMTLTTDDKEEITVTVVKFESVHAFDLVEVLQANMDKLHRLRREMLACTYVVRDHNGSATRIDFAGLQGKQLDEAMNRAFRGTGAGGIAKAINFAVEVNFGSFFAAALAEKKRKDAEQMLLKPNETTEELP